MALAIGFFLHPGDCVPRYADATAQELAAYDDDCAICRERMATAKKLACGHIFHGACLQAWLVTQGSCPICRRDVGDNANTADTASGARRRTGPPSVAVNAPGALGGRTRSQAHLADAATAAAAAAASVSNATAAGTLRRTGSSGRAVPLTGAASAAASLLATTPLDPPPAYSPPTDLTGRRSPIDAGRSARTNTSRDNLVAGAASERPPSGLRTAAHIGGSRCVNAATFDASRYGRIS